MDKKRACYKRSLHQPPPYFLSFTLSAGKKYMDEVKFLPSEMLSPSTPKVAMPLRFMEADSSEQGFLVALLNSSTKFLGHVTLTPFKVDSWTSTRPSV
jgi:hypothetical protein